MGVFSFVQGVGRKLGIVGDRKDPEAEAAAKAARKAAADAKLAEAAQRAEAERNAVELDVYAAIASYVAIEDLGVRFDGLAVHLTGTAADQADREKAILVAGNTEGVASVHDDLAVAEPDAPEATFHTVEKGDTLSAIAKAVYGEAMLYPLIFAANRPMLEHPDRIYPGQVLRIPPRDHATYTVQKGDTLGGIAKALLGAPGRYTEIFEANRDQLDDPNRIAVGMVLRIP